MGQPGTSEQPLRVAIVGSGPSGFYAAGHLLNEKELTVEVDMFDSLPTPWGLVRAGVAPDHPNIKAVSRVFEKTAAKPGFRFFGNVTIGSDVDHSELMRRYHAVIYACGAQTDRHMGIPGEDLPGSRPATEFVAWYNGHPEFRDLEFDLSGRTAVIVGNGNVAMDCARMLALAPDELAKTDVADHALEVLRSSNISEIIILGRRGPAQAAFTNPELLEMADLEEADVIVDSAEMSLDEPSAASIEEEGELTARRNVEILREFANKEPQGRPKRVQFRFLVSPLAIEGDGRVQQVELVHNELYVTDDGSIRPRPTDRRDVIEADLVLRSIGYKGVESPGVPFDDGQGVIPNEGGRVLTEPGGDHVGGLYCVGWIKRGPTGVIGTNKKDANETVDLVLEDLGEGRLPDPEDADAASVEALVSERKPDHVTYVGWEAIDAVEKGLGEPQGRPRVKLCSRDELLDAANNKSAQPA